MGLRGASWAAGRASASRGCSPSRPGAELWCSAREGESLFPPGRAGALHRRELVPTHPLRPRARHALQPRDLGPGEILACRRPPPSSRRRAPARAGADRSKASSHKHHRPALRPGKGPRLLPAEDGFYEDPRHRRQGVGTGRQQPDPLRRRRQNVLPNRGWASISPARSWSDRQVPPRSSRSR